jgi:SseB protein N-terminal domain
MPAGGDIGEPDRRLAAALLAQDAAAIRAALLEARVLVPVVATGDDSESAVMAVPRLVGADGRHALPVFSCSDSLRAWRADARPVPMPGSQAVAGALDEGYAAIVVDVAGPASHVVELRAATL